MRTSTPDFRSRNRINFNRGTLAACLLVLFACSHHAMATEVAAVVNDGTLEITRDLGTTGEGFFGLTITLAGQIDEDIRVYVDGELLGEPIPRNGISKIDIFADHSQITFWGFDFEGDLEVEVLTGGLCDLAGLDLKGDFLARGSAGSVYVAYRFTFIDGDLTVEGGPGDDGIGLYDSRYLIVTGNLNFDGGPGNDFVDLNSAHVLGDTLIKLGESSGSETDSDYCSMESSTLSGDVAIDGDQGNDRVYLSCSIGGNLLVDLGNGADRLRLSFGFWLSEDSSLILNGGNGNSDELSSIYFPLLPEEYSGFETVNIP